MKPPVIIKMKVDTLRKFYRDPMTPEAGKALLLQTIHALEWVLDDKKE